MKRRLLGFGVVLAVVAVAVLVIVVAIPTRVSSRAVPVVGDSITFLAARNITTGLSGEYRPRIRAKVGQRIDQMLPSVAESVRGEPFAVVVNLGTNDALQADTHPNWKTGFDKMIDLLAPARCVVLTTISTLSHNTPATPTVAADINEAIAAAAASHSNFHVADWNAVIHGEKAEILLDGDKIHPSSAGQLTLAALVRSTLDRDCRAT